MLSNLKDSFTQNFNSNKVRLKDTKPLPKNPANKDFNSNKVRLKGLVRLPPLPFQVISIPIRFD